MFTSCWGAGIIKWLIFQENLCFKVLFVHSDSLLSRIGIINWVAMNVFICMCSFTCVRHKLCCTIWKSQTNCTAGFSIVSLWNVCSCCRFKVSIFLSDGDLDYRQMLTEILSPELQFFTAFQFCANTWMTVIALQDVIAPCWKKCETYMSLFWDVERTCSSCIRGQVCDYEAQLMSFCFKMCCETQYLTWKSC